MGTSDIAGMSHLSSGTSPPGNTTHKNQNLNQMLPFVEGEEAGLSMGAGAARGGSGTNTGRSDIAPTNCHVSGAKRIKTNQSPASDPMVDYEVAPPRVNLSRNCWTKMPTIDTAIAKEHAVYESVLMHHNHRKLGNKVSLACCVAHVNGFMSASLVTLPSAQNWVQLSRCPCHLKSRSHEFQSHRYLYFQKMSTDRHSLIQKSQHKKRSHLPAEDLPMIAKEVAVKITSRMAYVKTDLHRVPHGSNCLSTKPQTNLLLDKMHVTHATVNHGGQTGVANLKGGFGLVVLFPNHASFARNDIYIREWELLKYLLYNPDAVRDSREVGTSVKIRSLIWGVGQNQAVTSKNNRQYNLNNRRVETGLLGPVSDGTNIPTFGAEVFHHFPEKIKDFLFSWMEIGQTVVKKYWGTTALGDRVQNNLFAKCLNKMMGKANLKANFEYYDVILTKAPEPLVRHMDYFNDGQSNYNHCFVYSFQLMEGTVLYRVSFIMTSQSHAGAAVDYIRARLDDRKNNV
jgi:hypothetical protein